MIRVDEGRLLADLRALAQFGKVDTGVHRLAFSPEDLDARAFLVQRFAEAGLDAHIDSTGSVFGRSPSSGPAVLIGSHTDSVPRGGWLDGALGVIYGLEIARVVRENSTTQDLAVDVASFQDEEGTFFACLGSKVFCGDVHVEDVLEATNKNGERLGAVLNRIGILGNSTARLEPGRYRAYLEAHIEQGPRLEAESSRIGVVTGIVGIRRFLISFQGQADHAGTTPMSMRKDAGGALLELACAIQRAFRRLAGESTVWNFGNVRFEPGAANVVPARAELTVEFRDLADARLAAIEQELRRLVADQAGRVAVAIAVRDTATIHPVQLDLTLGDHIAAAAEARGVSYMRMPSGAGHDAMVLARHVPSAMLFVPSVGGRSHDVGEDTREGDIVLGCQVLADAVCRILGR